MDKAEGMLDLVHETCQQVFDEGDYERDIAIPPRAYLRFKHCRLDEAVALQQRVVVRDRENLDALLFLAQLHEKLRDYDEARKVMRRANSVAYFESCLTSEDSRRLGWYGHLSKTSGSRQPRGILNMPSVGGE